MATVSYGAVRVTCRSAQVTEIAAQVALRVGEWQTIGSSFGWDDAFFVLFALEQRRICSMEELCRALVSDQGTEPIRQQQRHVRSVIRDIQRTCCQFGLPAYCLVSMTARRGKLVYLAGAQLDEFLQTLDQVSAEQERARS